MKKRVVKFRPSSLEERKKFYEKEFNIEKVKEWFYKNRMKLPQLCAIDAGSETGIIIDKKLKGQMLYFPFKELKEKIKKYIPEDLYYDRNIYENPNTILRNFKFNKFLSQELAFDIDADNIICNCGKAELCDSCVMKALKQSIRMKKELEKDFDDVKLVYSGRGFHVHVLDGRAFKLSVNERIKLNKKFSDYPIDQWVSRGDIRLIRMPYSLNGLVSRKVIPIENSLGFNKKISYPRFLLYGQFD